MSSPQPHRRQTRPRRGATPGAGPSPGLDELRARLRWRYLHQDDPDDPDTDGRHDAINVWVVGRVACRPCGPTSGALAAVRWWMPVVGLCGGEAGVCGRMGRRNLPATVDSRTCVRWNDRRGIRSRAARRGDRRPRRARPRHAHRRRTARAGGRRATPTGPARCRHRQPAGPLGQPPRLGRRRVTDPGGPAGPGDQHRRRLRPRWSCAGPVSWRRCRPPPPPSSPGRCRWITSICWPGPTGRGVTPCSPSTKRRSSCSVRRCGSPRRCGWSSTGVDAPTLPRPTTTPPGVVSRPADASTTIDGRVVLNGELDPAGGAAVVGELDRLEREQSLADERDGVIRSSGSAGRRHWSRWPAAPPPPLVGASRSRCSPWCSVTARSSISASCTAALLRTRVVPASPERAGHGERSEARNPYRSRTVSRLGIRERFPPSQKALEPFPIPAQFGRTPVSAVSNARPRVSSPQNRRGDEWRTERAPGNVRADRVIGQASPRAAFRLGWSRSRSRRWSIGQSRVTACGARRRVGRRRTRRPTPRPGGRATGGPRHRAGQREGRERLGRRVEADERVGAEVAEPHGIGFVDEHGVWHRIVAGQPPKCH